jgi:hypothetical protein
MGSGVRGHLVRRHISTAVDFPTPSGGKQKRYRRVHLRALEARIAKRLLREKHKREKQKGTGKNRRVA